MNLYFEVKDTEVCIKESKSPVADSENYIKCFFDFLSDQWQEGEKTVYIGNYAVLLNDNFCTLPQIPKGIYPVGVGIVKKDGTKIYTETVSIYFRESAKPDSIKDFLEPSLYEQLLAKIDGISGGTLDVSKVEDIIKEYLEKNPPEVDNPITEEKILEIVEKYVSENPPKVEKPDVTEDIKEWIHKFSIKGEAEGRELNLTDSFDWGVQEFELRGISDQEGIPAPTNPLPITNAGVYNPDKDAYEITIKFTDTEEQEQEIILTTKKQLCKWDKLVKKDGKWYWEYRTYQMEFDGSERWLVYDTYKGFSGVLVLPEGGYRNDGVCNQYKPTLIPTWDKNSMWIGTAGVKYLYCINADFYDASLEDKGLANFKEHLSKNHLILQSYLTTPEFVELEKQEQEALKSLVTYYPNTTITNDQNCPMYIKYVADTTNYVNNKMGKMRSEFSLELENAINTLILKETLEEEG